MHIWKNNIFSYKCNDIVRSKEITKQHKGALVKYCNFGDICSRNESFVLDKLENLPGEMPL